MPQVIVKGFFLPADSSNPNGVPAVRVDIYPFDRAARAVVGSPIASNATLLLDTGAGRTVINTSRINVARIKPIQTGLPATTAGGVTRTSVYSLRLVFRDASSAGFGLPVSAGGLAMPAHTAYAGLIGLDAIGSGELVVSKARNIVTLTFDGEVN